MEEIARLGWLYISPSTGVELGFSVEREEGQQQLRAAARLSPVAIAEPYRRTDNRRRIVHDLRIKGSGGFESCARDSKTSPLDAVGPVGPLSTGIENSRRLFVRIGVVRDR